MSIFLSIIAVAMSIFSVVLTLYVYFKMTRNDSWLPLLIFNICCTAIVLGATVITLSSTTT